jgi:hypothetical protein
VLPPADESGHCVPRDLPTRPQPSDACRSRPAEWRPLGTPTAVSSPDELTVRQVSSEFPGFVIWQEMTAPGRLRYGARRRHRGTHPHTVITADLAELRDTLAGNTPPPASHPQKP